MGMCLDPTPEMGEYSVEVRRESFYLRGAYAYRETKQGVPHAIVVYPEMEPQSIYGSVELDLEDIPKIRAALDQVEQYLKSK